jgi:AhpC/TSA family
VRDRYSLFVGLIFAAIIVIAVINTLEHKDEGTLGLDKLSSRWPLPEFAVPRVSGSLDLEGDANVAQDDCETAQAPCPRSAQREAACRISTPGAIRVCDLFNRPLVISFWFSRGGNDCTDQQSVVDQVYRRYRGRVNFLSLDIRDDRSTVRELIERNRWKLPVGYDRDGAVAGLYRVGLCPTFAYVYPGGTLQEASIGELTAPQLEARINNLLQATRVAEGS